MGIRTRGFHPAIYAMQASMELRRELVEGQMAKTEKLQLKKTYWYQRMSRAMEMLKAADPAGWEAWFDSDAVPDARFSEMAPIVETRVSQLLNVRKVRVPARLYRGVFVWRDQSGYFIFGDDGRIYEFEDEGLARGHIDATLAMCGGLLGSLIS
jgi:hypothetical protein